MKPDFEGPLPTQTLGDKRPLAPEEQIARDIIAKAPHSTTPYAVARYFLSVANGEFGIELKPYAQGWPVRWNPVIVNFFQATQTKPEGDLTSWCAAFVNWCFLQAGKGKATNNASSGSFRCFGTASASPKEGDLVVFRRIDSEGKCIGRGHVGFVIRDRVSEIEVLGGNQIEGHEHSHKISQKRIPKDGKLLKFHSFRSESRLQT